MKKKLCLALALVMLLPGCGNTKAPDNPYRLKKTTIEYYDRDRETTVWEFENTYDENGWLVANQEYQDGAADTKIIYEHDTYGNIIRTTQIHTDGTVNVGEDKLTLDDQHRVIYQESTWNGELMATTETAYNKDGQVTKLYINRINVLEGEDWKSFVDKTYDRKGRLVREDTRWEPDHNSSGYTVYLYEKDRLVRAESYLKEDLDSYTEYTYDETGLIRTAIGYDADGIKESKRITTYDEYGNELESVAYGYASERVRYGEADEEPDSRTIYVYELK